MSPLDLLLVAAGGALGAVARFVVDAEVTRRSRGRTPVPPGTLVVNAAGSFALGVLAALAPVGAAPDGAPPGWLLFAGTGVCGGFTTFSTASLDAVRRAAAGRWGAAAATAGAHLGVSLAAVSAGALLVPALRSLVG